MATDDDDTLTLLGKPRLRSPADIVESDRHYPQTRSAILEQDSQPPPKKSDPLPRPGDRYRACARFLNRLSSETRLIHFVLGDFTCEGFAYADLRRLRWLEASDPGSGPILVLRFVEVEATEVRIEGRHLEDIHYYISEGSMPWVWEQPAGFRVRDDNAPVITRIAITEMEQ